MLPDLNQLLGPYSAEYHGALLKTPRELGHPFLRVKTNGLVVEEWGHVRDLEGRAYVPDLVPPDVQVDTIK